jgi:hypothetical protein
MTSFARRCRRSRASAPLGLVVLPALESGDRNGAILTKTGSAGRSTFDGHKATYSAAANSMTVSVLADAVERFAGIFGSSVVAKDAKFVALAIKTAQSVYAVADKPDAVLLNNLSLAHAWNEAQRGSPPTAAL